VCVVEGVGGGVRRWRWEGGGEGRGKEEGRYARPLGQAPYCNKCQHLAFIHLRRAADESVVMPGTWPSAHAAGASVIITSNSPRPSLGADPDTRPHPPHHPLLSTHFLTGRKLEPKPRAATSMARYPMAASLTAMVEVEMGWACP